MCQVEPEASGGAEGGDAVVTEEEKEEGSEDEVRDKVAGLPGVDVDDIIPEDGDAPVGGARGPCTAGPFLRFSSRN